MSPSAVKVAVEAGEKLLPALERKPPLPQAQQSVSLHDLSTDDSLPFLDVPTLEKTLPQSELNLPVLGMPEVEEFLRDIEETTIATDEDKLIGPKGTQQSPNVNGMDSSQTSLRQNADVQTEANTALEPNSAEAKGVAPSTLNSSPPQKADDHSTKLEPDSRANQPGPLAGTRRGSLFANVERFMLQRKENKEDTSQAGSGDVQSGTAEVYEPTKEIFETDIDMKEFSCTDKSSTPQPSSSSAHGAESKPATSQQLARAVANMMSLRSKLLKAVQKQKGAGASKPEPAAEGKARETIVKRDPVEEVSSRASLETGGVSSGMNKKRPCDAARGATRARSAASGATQPASTQDRESKVSVCSAA